MYTKIISEIQRIAIEEGEVIRRAFYDPTSVDFVVKNSDLHKDKDIVTAIDKHIEEAFYKQLKDKFPELGFYLEEAPELNDESKELVCYIDPIDGTKYFANDIPLFSMSVGILKNKEPVLGVIYNPLTRQMYAGAEGIPTTMNGRQVSVSGVRKVEDAIIVLDMSTHKENWKEEHEWMNEKMVKFNTMTRRIRLFGAGALSCAWVSSGGIDAYIDMWGHKEKLFDIVAGKALIKYAGGTVHDLNIPNLKEPRFVGGNEHLTNAICELLLD
jgi:myo-inositol-1(or 4)-monophosphatase